MPELDPAAREHLGKVSAARFEAETFLARHPSFFSTKQNGDTIIAYLTEHNLLCNAENMEYAFGKLKAAGKILPAKEVLASMTADEFKKFVDKNGVPAYDAFGRVRNELPSAYLVETTVDYNRSPQKPGPMRTMAQSRPRTGTPKWETGKKLSKREYALLPADDHQDFHAWLEENGISLEEAVR
jgi:hypothetical protein